MELVINRCYGGFSLSPLAVQELAKRKGKKCFFFTYDCDKGYVPTTLEKLLSKRTLFFCAFSRADAPTLLNRSKDWGEMTTEERQAENALHDELDLPSRPPNRSDPDLIAVVRELGEAANGGCAELAIVSVPDGVEWEIDEYDGVEHVAETHRTWR